MISSRNKKYLLILPLFFLLSFFGKAEAATLYFSPASGNETTGNIMNVNVLVNTQGQTINSADTIIIYPTKFLEVVSISKSSSIFSLWVEEPTFSNSSGTINLSGGLPSPGYNGTAGKIIGITFRLKVAGSASLVFSSGAVRANDGYGTDVLSSLGTATYTITPAPVAPVVPTPEDAEVVPPQAEESPLILDLGNLAPNPQADEGVSINIPPWRVIWAWTIKVFSVAIPLFALIFLLIHTTKRGVGNIRALRKDLRKDLHNIDRLVEKSFDIIKEDISESIHILERARTKRRLTAEEDAIIHRLRQNLVDAEKVIHLEVVHTEKDLGD